MLDWLLNIQYFCRRKLSRSAIWDASPHATGMSMLYRSKWRQQAMVTPRRLYRTINLPCLAQAWPDCHSPESFQPTGQIGKGGGSDWGWRRLHHRSGITFAKYSWKLRALLQPTAQSQSSPSGELGYINTYRTVCRQVQDTVHHIFSSLFWSAPVMRNLQKGTL